eukprot:765657-Hanusia_phi.AAC.2
MQSFYHPAHLAHFHCGSHDFGPDAVSWKGAEPSLDSRLVDRRTREEEREEEGVWSKVNQEKVEVERRGGGDDNDEVEEEDIRREGNRGAEAMHDNVRREATRMSD